MPKYDPKYTRKRPHFTPDSFHQFKECPSCGGSHFSCSRQLNTRYGFYRIMGWQTKKVVWKIYCKCKHPIGVILKPEHWDSAQ